MTMYVPLNEVSVGKMLAFKRTTSAVLCDIPAKVVQVWPPFRTGNCLVTLSYEPPVRLEDKDVSQVDALISELYAPYE